MNAPLTAVMAQEHVSDLTRAAARFNDTPSRPLWRSGPAVELRPARGGRRATRGNYDGKFSFAS